MNKVELSIELGLSVQTINRYQGMGMPFEKIGGRYDFDLSEVENWIDDNIDSRPEERLQPMTQKEARDSLHRLINLLLEHTDPNLLALHAEGSCPIHHKKATKK